MKYMMKELITKMYVLCVTHEEMKTIHFKVKNNLKKSDTEVFFM